MIKLLRVYRVLLRAAWLRALEYRAQLILWLLSSVFPLVMMAVWLALVDQAGAINGWGQSDFISYYVATTLVSQLTSAYLVWTWDENIRTGSLSMKLLKPVDPAHQMIGLELMGWKMLVALIIGPIVIMLALLSPSVNYTTNPLFLLAFVATVTLAGLMNVALACLFGVIAFWTTQSRNLYNLVFGVGQFLAGFIAPLAMFPEGIQQIARVLPFRSTLGLPVEILMGRLSLSEIGIGLAVTMLWGVLFFILYRALWPYALRRYEAVGA